MNTDSTATPHTCQSGGRSPAITEAVRKPAASYLPGLWLVLILTTAAYGLSLVFPSFSPLIWALLLGMTVAAARPLPPRLLPGVGLAGRQILRIGVALLGLRIAMSQLLEVGVPGLLIAVAVVPTVVLVTVWLGRRLGVRPGLAILIGSGSAVCGAAAVAAVAAVIESEKEDVSYAVGTVTLFGTLALVALPVLEHNVLHLGASAYGVWAGASVHEVAQVVAAAAPAGATAVKVATVVKLSRVMLLGPFLLALGLIARRDPQSGHRPWLPLFVVAFLACVGLSSLGIVPSTWQPIVGGADTLLLAAALAGLGLSVRLGETLQLGWRPLALGLGASLTAGVMALGGVLILVH